MSASTPPQARTPFGASASLAGLAVSLLAVFVLVACEPVVADANALAASAPPAPTVQVARVEATQIEASQMQIGRVEAAQRVEVRPRVGGHIEAVLFKEGSIVRAGQPLFRIDARTHAVAQQRSDAELELARVQERQAQTELHRAQRLFADRAISAQEVERRSAALAEAQARTASFEAARSEATLQREFTVIHAPISGRIGRALVTAGNYVGTGSNQAPLTTIVSVAPLHVHFDVDAKLAAQHLKASAGSSPWTARILDTDGSQEWARAPIDFADNEVTGTTGTLRMRATIAQPNPELVPGRFVRVQLATAAAQPTLTVPEKAIGTDQAQRFVLIATADGSVERRTVQLGGREGEQRIVTHGLEAGDLVIVSGLMRVRPGMKVQPELALAHAPKPSAPV